MAHLGYNIPECPRHHRNNQLSASLKDYFKKATCNCRNYIFMLKKCVGSTGHLETRKVFKKNHTCGLLFLKLGYTFSYLL